MAREDALIALERHATSKVSCIEICSASRHSAFAVRRCRGIASVSQFELLTRTAEALEGTKVTVEGVW